MGAEHQHKARYTVPGRSGHCSHKRIWDGEMVDYREEMKKLHHESHSQTVPNMGFILAFLTCPREVASLSSSPVPTTTSLIDTMGDGWWGGSGVEHVDLRYRLPTNDDFGSEAGKICDLLRCLGGWHHEQGCIGAKTGVRAFSTDSERGVVAIASDLSDGESISLTSSMHLGHAFNARVRQFCSSPELGSSARNRNKRAILDAGRCRMVISDGGGMIVEATGGWSSSRLDRSFDRSVSRCLRATDIRGAGRQPRSEHGKEVCRAKPQLRVWRWWLDAHLQSPTISRIRPHASRKANQP
nr:hypothetical protein CFP56_01235 [Quercus suber]